MMRTHHFPLRASQRLNSIRFPAKAAVRLLTTLLVFSLCLFPNIATAASPHIYDSPLFGPPTSQVQVAGTGFDPNASIDVYFDSTDVGVTVSDSNGAFGLAATPKPTIRESGFLLHVPEDAVPGQHWITAVERITQLQAQVSFTVRADWPQFQFGPDHTGLNPYENVLSLETVGNLTIHWTYTGKGPVYSSPVVADGMVYAAANRSDVYALNADTGTLVWSYPTEAAGYSAPAVANGRVYFFAAEDPHYLGALNANTGALLWKYTLDGDSIEGPTVVANGVVYIARSAKVNALDGRTGALLWTAQVPLPTGVAVANGSVYVSSEYGMYALDARTGALVWKVSGPEHGFWFAVVANGIVYAGSAVNDLYALDASMGALLWKYSGGTYPVVANGVLYVGDTNVHALDAVTGALLWTSASLYPTSLAVANGVVYVGSYHSQAAYALNATTGELLWNYAIGRAISGSLAVVNGAVYIADDSNKLYAFTLPNQHMAEKFSPRQRPDPARLTPNWFLQPSSQVTPPFEK